jgi:hypothetical protein
MLRQQHRYAQQESKVIQGKTSAEQQSKKTCNRCTSKIVPPRYKHRRSLSSKTAPLRRNVMSKQHCCLVQQTSPRVSPDTQRGRDGSPDALHVGMGTLAGAAASVPDEQTRISPEHHHTTTSNHRAPRAPRGCTHRWGRYSRNWVTSKTGVAARGA